MIFWHRLGTPFPPILVPTWPQLGPQLGPKIHQKSIQEPSKIHPNLHLIFDPFFNWFVDRFVVEFRFPNGSKINQKSINKSSQQHNNQKIKKPILYCNLQYNRALGHVMLSTKIDKNRLSILQKTASKSMLQLGSILEPTWLHFGGGVGGSKCGQVGSNWL